MVFTIAETSKAKKRDQKQAITIISIGLGVMVAGILALRHLDVLGKRAYISVETLKPAEVRLADESIGDTPISSREIKHLGGNIKIVDKTNENRMYETDITCAPDTEIVLNHDLGVSELFSSGRDVWLKQGKTGITIISQPTGATITLDGETLGKTPFSTNKPSAGDYTITVALQGYESQTIRVKVIDGYNLNIAVKLFPIPVPVTVQKFENSQNLWDLTIDNEVIAGAPDRARAVNYWLDTRPSQGLEVKHFDYFLDYRGTIYDAQGNSITDKDTIKTLIKNAKAGAYLGYGQTNTGLSQEARKTYEEYMGSIKQAKILPTGLGWLRVRETPGRAGKELGKATVGKQYAVIDEKDGWIKIQLDGNTTGWIAGQYAEILD